MDGFVSMHDLFSVVVAAIHISTHAITLYNIFFWTQLAKREGYYRTPTPHGVMENRTANY